MIGRKLMAWLFPGRFTAEAEQQLDATISASLMANEKVAEAATAVNEAAEFSQALMENVAFDARQRALASKERRAAYQRMDPHVKVVIDVMNALGDRS